MENSHKYFKRDISWLSFNYRVLLEAEDETLPIYERIKFLSIYSSNLEEFYEIRVAEHRGVIMKKNFTEESGAEAEETLAEITEEVNRQQREYYRIFSKVLQELNRQDIYLYQDSRPEPFHEEFVHNFFNEEVFPFLSPVMIQAGDIRTFIRDRRLYLVIRMVKKSKRMAEPDYVPDYYYALMKIPYAKVPRFIELPTHEGKHYIMFIDDIIRANLSSIFPGYVVESCYSIKISRDADIYLDDEKGGNIVENIRKKVKKRKIGALSRFMYDSNMPDDFLAFICNAFGITTDDLVLGGRYNNLQDLIKLPNPRGKELEQQVPSPMRVPFLDRVVFDVARKVPTEYKVNKENTKFAMRQAAHRYLPDMVAEKKKLGFPVPIRIWLREENYYNMVKEAFHSPAAEEFFKVDEIMKYLDEHKAGKADNSRKIWTIYMFLVWHKQFFG